MKVPISVGINQFVNTKNDFLGQQPRLRLLWLSQSRIIISLVYTNNGFCFTPQKQTEEEEEEN